MCQSGQRGEAMHSPNYLSCLTRFPAGGADSSTTCLARARARFSRTDAVLTSKSDHSLFAAVRSRARSSVERRTDTCLSLLGLLVVVIGLRYLISPYTCKGGIAMPVTRNSIHL